ncbi:Ion transport protein-domain-containing protein [Dichotomocladium elegans]|nr:Ion transport protein-domain-containing protein [Dichotomocladium elegans]
MSDPEPESAALNDVPTPTRTKTFMTFQLKERETLPLSLSAPGFSSLHREREDPNQSTPLLSQSPLAATYDATAEGQSPAATAARITADQSLHTSTFPLVAVGPGSTLGDGNGLAMPPRRDRWMRDLRMHDEFQYFLLELLENTWTDRLFTLLLLLHVIVLMIVGRGADPFPEPPWQWGQTWDQYVILGIFTIYTVHVLARIIVYGLFQARLDESLAFMRHSWNRIDFIADDLGLQIIVNADPSSASAHHSGKPCHFAEFEKSRTTASDGVQSFKGSYMRRCVWQDPYDPSNIQILQQYCGSYIQNGVKRPYLFQDGTSAPWPRGFVCQEGLICREVGNPSGGTINFDNIFNSMLLVIITAGSQTWTEPMYDMMDAEYGVACLYFIAIVIVMNFWLINLFVAVINETFAKIRQDTHHSAFSVSKQPECFADRLDRWLDGESTRKVPSKHPNQFLPRKSPFLDRACSSRSSGDGIENQRYDTSSAPDNRADLIIAVMTCIIQIPAIHGNHALYAWLTGFQVVRAYRLVVAIPRLRTLSSRVLGSVWGLLNLVFFIALSTLIIAIMGFQLLEGQLNESDNEMRFFSVYNSFVGLNQLFSGEDWTTVLYDAMEAGVPTRTSTTIVVMVNMFIAVLMENFETAEEEKRMLQVQQYFAQNQQAVKRDPVISSWNIYRYFRPHPKPVSIHNIPHGLILPATTTAVSEFMHGDISISGERELAIAGPSTLPGKISAGSNRFTRFFKDIFPTSKTAPLNIARKSMPVDALDPLDQLQERTAYNYDTQTCANTGNPYPILMAKLLVTIKNPNRDAMLEAMVYDIEGRKAERQEFIASHPTYDRPLYLFPQRSLIRRLCQKLVPPSHGERLGGVAPSSKASWMFFGLVSTAAVATVVLTIYNSPVYQLEHPHQQAIFRQLDWIITLIFTFEMVIKVIADGFLFTPNAYLLNGWNILDLLILLTLYISHFGEFTSATGVERGFRALKALRALRLMNLLRPAREMFSFILVKGLFFIIDTALLCLFLIVPFALYGQNLFQGLFYGCNDDGVSHRSMCLFEGMLGTQQPMPEETVILAPRIWENPYVYSFDSFWKGLLVLVEIASGEGWIDVLETSMSLAGKDLNHERDISQYTGIFFMVYNLIGSVLVISLFLGVVLENFSHRSGSAYLTVDQRRWRDLKKLLNQIRPLQRPNRPPTTPIRKWCFSLVDDKNSKFYAIMKTVIVLNILFLCTELRETERFAGLSRTRVWLMIIKENIQTGFLIIFWVEMMIKLLALGWKSFRRNKSNLFDLAVVFGASGAILGGTHMVAIEAKKLFMTALCFKLVQRSDNLNQLFTITAQIINVFAVWFIIMTTYAIVFMQIFGLTKYGTQATSEHVNFRTYASTMISLVRFSTGEAWNTVMHDFTVQYPNCVIADEFLDSDCGSSVWSFVLFLSFNVISMYIFTAIFVAIVAENFSYVYQIASNYSLGVGRCRYEADRLHHVKGCHVFLEEFSYKRLCQQCSIPSSNRKKHSKNDPYRIKVDVELLGQKLDKLDKAELHQRKHVLDSLYWEAELVQSTKGSISFNAMLRMVARRKLVIPENAFQLDELLYNQRREDVVQTLIKIDRVRGMLETYALRKKFLQHRAQQPSGPSEEHRGISGILDMIPFYTHRSAPTSPMEEETSSIAKTHVDDNAPSPRQTDRASDRVLWQAEHQEALAKEALAILDEEVQRRKEDILQRTQFLIASLKAQSKTMINQLPPAIQQMSMREFCHTYGADTALYLKQQNELRMKLAMLDSPLGPILLQMERKNHPRVGFQLDPQKSMEELGEFSVAMPHNDDASQHLTALQRERIVQQIQHIQDKLEKVKGLFAFPQNNNPSSNTPKGRTTSSSSFM